jgi:CHAT domain-containing protein
VGADGPASPLPAARREIRALARDFASAGAAYPAAAATEHAIRTLAPRYQYVHFAAHAVLDDDDPLYSGLSVAPPSDAERSLAADSDDFLQVYEMFDLGLSADVVMCSACQTAGGHIRPGEGLIGMSRALLFAGARSLVLTVWPVADYPTERLARQFYRELRHRRSPGTALAVAKQAVRASHPHVYGDPFAWAGLILIGHR